MTEIATLGIKVDSSDIRTASNDVRDFVASMGRAEKVSGVTGRALKTMSNEARGAAGSLARVDYAIGKLSSNDRSSPIKLSSSLIALNVKSSDGSGRVQLSGDKSQSAPNGESSYRRSPELKYYMENRPDEGKNASDMALSLGSQAIKSASSLFGGFGAFFADIFFSSVADKVDGSLPSNRFETSKKVIADRARMTDELRKLSLNETPAMKINYENSHTENGLVSALETPKKLSDSSLEMVRDTFNSIKLAAEMQFGTDSFIGGGNFTELEKQYNEIKPLILSGKATRQQYQTFGNSVAENAAKNPQFVNLQTFAQLFKDAMPSMIQNSEAYRDYVALDEKVNKNVDATSAAINAKIKSEQNGAAPAPPAEQQRKLSQIGALVETFFPALSSFARAAPLVIEAQSKQVAVGSVDVQRNQKDELQGVQQATDTLTKSTQANTEQTKLGIQTSAQSAAATDNVKSKVVTLKQSQDELQKSCAVQLAQMPQLTKAANEQADAYRRVADAQALQKLAGDIQFQQDQMGRSTVDQTVASTQKQYGLPVDMNSASANIIRYNEQLKYARELAGDFASTLVSGLRNGEGLWKSLGKAAISVLTKISDRLLNDVLNSLFKVNSAAAGGGLFGGGGIGGLLGGGGGLDLGILARSPQAAAAVASGIPGLWADGGYTGPGGKNDPAGIVHAGEVVWSQKDIARAGGVGVVEAMRLGRRGYADGGVVGEGGPQLVRAQPDASVPVRRLRADNQNDAAGSASGVHVTVGVSVDEDGNLKAYVKNVAQSEAQSSTRQGLNDFNQQLPDRVAQINRNPRRR
ncbi:hypothetical protein GR212_17230 [Rhizobium lusitanum]|uniref:Phage tail tape measure protein n=1 Tax=Rhizobium lusitanum TaxID=293958 RepID=A0A6L9U5Y5_9HYPH|nr:hypothetical protein [Rhizobium lusitanum]NEI71323.1 hypothetical protein [Rhizobium lusitanum]